MVSSKIYFTQHSKANQKPDLKCEARKCLFHQVSSLEQMKIVWKKSAWDGWKLKDTSKVLRETISPLCSSSKICLAKYQKDINLVTESSVFYFVGYCFVAMVTQVTWNCKFANCTVRELWKLQVVNNGKRCEGKRGESRNGVIEAVTIWPHRSPCINGLFFVTAIRLQIEESRVFHIKNKQICQVRYRD